MFGYGVDTFFVIFDTSLFSLAVTCPSITVTNGTVTGQCGGNYSGTCTYASCNAGYYMSSNGTAARTCQQNGTYSGSPMACLRK